MEAVRFYVEGVHCANCLKKIDSLKGTVDGVGQIDFDMSTKTLSAQLDQRTSDLKLQSAIEKLGFSARILESEGASEALSKASDRDLLFRLSLAGLAAGNIMLLAVSIYAGATGAEAQFMNSLSLILAVPAVLYSAWPIHRMAFRDLVRFQISVELPISVAILAGFGLSVWSLLTGGTHIYFDSISVLIFLVLGGRFLLARVQQKYLGLSRFQSLFQIGHVDRHLPNGQIESVDIRDIKSKDRILVRSGHVIPVDGILSSTAATLDTSLLTGETRPHEILIGETIFLGQKNLGDDIELQALNGFRDSRLFRILNEVEQAIAEKPRAIQMLDKVGQAFLIAVFILAAACLAYFAASDPNEGIRRALAVILVSCPCTFAFGAPLVFSLAMNRVAGLGILVKHPNVFEKLLSIRQVVLDKTGTLTDGVYDLVKFDNVAASDDELSTVKAICESSKHPVSRGLTRYLSKLRINSAVIEGAQIQELPTVGLQAKVDGHTYLINRFGVTKDNTPLVALEMGDEVWPEAVEMVDQLKAHGFPIYLSSGDSQDRVREIAGRLGLSPAAAFSSQSPEMKANFLASHPFSLMVGDGANDSLALTKADVGVAVHGSLGTALQASDIYLLKKDLRLIPSLIAFAKTVNRVLRRNLRIAVAYNLIAAALAVTGFIHPLLAAVLMPLSSFSQLISGLGVIRGPAWK